jgi:hypothetical protein
LKKVLSIATPRSLARSKATRRLRLSTLAMSPKATRMLAAPAGPVTAQMTAAAALRRAAALNQVFVAIMFPPIPPFNQCGDLC